MKNTVPNAERKMPVSSYRLPAITREQIAFLAERWGCSKADVVNRTVDQAFNLQVSLDEKGVTVVQGEEIEPD